MASLPSTALTLTVSDGLRWYRSSATAERGFCATCGGNLFWRQLDGDTTSVAAGTLDSPTGLKVDKHIFVASKGDYYSIDDSAPQFQESD